MLLYFVFKTIKQPVPKWRVLLSAIIGTAFALTLPLLSFSGVGMFFIRLFVGALMVFVVQNKSLGRYTLFLLLFLTYTFAFGGAVFGVMSMFGLESVPFGLVPGVVLAMFFIFKLLIKYLNVRHSVSQHLRDVVIHHKGERYKVTSYLDTGNRLVDPDTNAPVVIISLSLFLKMFPDIPPDKIVLNRLGESEVEQGKYIPLSTVAGKSKIFTFKPEKLEILKGKTHDNIRLGVSMRGFKDAVRYDALLHSALA
ncbi:MAG: sigma-E processing peptidase SpoIIGA [Firmicutes bacterium]|nr:sigma-E processing peptidase SpoIIGA [Bacillota bacterium]